MGVTRARATWAWFAAVMLLSAGLLFVDLADAPWRTWDEGLYARLSRNALEHGRYLFAVDEEGAYFKRFSKPPMSLWLTSASMSVFGIGTFALRLPFALGMLAVIGIAFGWGRRIGGLPMAVTWAGGLALCAATTRWGRHACIEPMFIAGMLGGLAAYHGSVVAPSAARARRWAVVSGLGFAFAVLTKQLAVGLGILPIIVWELWRRDRAALPRLALALGIPLLAATVWFAWVGVETDGAVFDVLIDRGLRRRMAGFEGGQNARTLNELSQVVAEASTPIPWPLGAAGLALLAVFRPREQLRMPAPDLLLPLWFASGVLVLENVSSSMLPWYAMHIVVPVVGGAAWLVSAAVHRAGRSPLRMAHAGLGWGTAAVVAMVASENIVSQLDVAILGGVLLVVAFARRPDVARVLALASVGLLMVAHRYRDPELHPPPQPFSPLMAALQDAPRVAVDRRAQLPQLARLGLFGPHTAEVGRAPWPTDEHDAYVAPWALPTEYEPPEGVTIHRTAGVTAFSGDLSTRAWSNATLKALLDAGPVTFEAEHLAAADWDTTYDAPEASGGQLRRYTQYRNEQPPKVPLSIGPKLRLPPGRYALEVWARWSCPARSGDRTSGVVFASTSDKEIVREPFKCDQAPDELTPQRFEFELKADSNFNMRVAFRYGTVEHDRTVLERLPE